MVQVKIRRTKIVKRSADQDQRSPSGKIVHKN